MDKPREDVKFGPLTFEGLPKFIEYYNPGLGWTIGATLSVTPRELAMTIDLIDERSGRSREKKFIDIRRL
ncbi:MAG: hypothetical protein KGH59_00980 [Candidatus Micrarchaeota archaeon]|nr:hypothetical protein [Candidatus Micrarchaeota archaeon]MDE1846552.1 hypothetical protein [Candidatus Micrarchaeota archaeon]